MSIKKQKAKTTTTGISIEPACESKVEPNKSVNKQITKFQLSLPRPLPAATPYTYTRTRMKRKNSAKKTAHSKSIPEEWQAEIYLL